MTIGVLGLGSIGARHVRNLQAIYPHARIDILTKRAQWEDKGENTTLVASPKIFFATKHDVYFVTNETVKHVASTLECLKQKPKGIFVEKPLSHSSKDLKKIERIALKQKTAIIVGYNLQFFSPLLEMKKILASKAIGKVLAMRVFVGQDLRTWRKTDYRKSYSADPKRGGGVVLDLIHDLNYPGWLLGEVLTVVAGHADTVFLPIKTEDVADSILVSPRGVIVSLHQDYLRTPGLRHCEIIGTKGTLTWDWPLRSESTIRIETATDSKTQEIVGNKNEMYIDEVKFFIKKARDGRGYTNLEESIRDIVNAEKIKHG